MLRKFVHVWAFLTLTATASAQAPNLFFTPPVLTSNTGVTAGTAAADINGDGKLDFLFTDGTVWVSKADGTYQPGTPWCTVAQTYCSQPGLPVLVATGDFNQDGKADIAVATSNFVFVLLGKGDGTFQAGLSSVTGSSATTVVVADVNGDGKPDVLLVGGTGAIPVLLGKGDGTFQAAIAGPNLAGFQYVAAADLNGDHKVDILGEVFNSASPNLGVFAGNGDGTFSSTPIQTSSGLPQNGFANADVQLADLDGDGKLDVVISQYPMPNLGAIPFDPTLQPQATYLAHGNGDGTFGTPTQIASRGGLISVGDFNGDGVADFVLTGPDIDVLIGTGGGQFTLKGSYFVGFATIRAIVGDFNGDGKADAFVGTTLLLGNGDGTLKANAVSYFASTVTPSALADFNGDGKADLAVVSSSGVTIDILTGDGTGRFAAGFVSPALNASQGVVDLKAADVTGDGKTDLLAVTSTDNSSVGWTVYLLAGNGDGTFEAPLAVAQSSQFFLGVAQLADVNNDHKLDLIVGDSSGAINVFLGNGDGSFSPSNAFFSGQTGPVSFVTGDFNGDGKVDLVVGVGSGLSFFPGMGDGTFGTAVTATTVIAGVTAVGDFNGDGILDLCGTNVVVLGNGDGTFKAGSTIPNTIQSINYNVAVDLNGDGKIDLVGSSTGGHIGEQALQYALGNGDGTFATPVVLEHSRIGISFQGPVVGDVNGDGRPDILFSFINGFISVLNTQPPASPDFSTTLTTPSSSTVAAGASATFGFSVAPTGGFAQTVSFTCSGAPAKSTCTVSPTSAMVNGSAPVAIKVTVATTAASSVSPVSFMTSPKGSQWPVGPIVVALLAILMAMSMAFLGSDPRKLAAARFRWATAGCSLVLVATSLLLISCGGGSSSSGSQSGTNSGTAAGSYTIHVTGTSGSGASAVSHTVTFTLTVQ